VNNMTRGPVLSPTGNQLSDPGKCIIRRHRRYIIYPASGPYSCNSPVTEVCDLKQFCAKPLIMLLIALPQTVDDRLFMRRLWRLQCGT